MIRRTKKNVQHLVQHDEKDVFHIRHMHKNNINAYKYVSASTPRSPRHTVFTLIRTQQLIVSFIVPLHSRTFPLMPSRPIRRDLPRPLPRNLSRPSIPRQLPRLERNVLTASLPRHLPRSPWRCRSRRRHRRIERRRARRDAVQFLSRPFRCGKVVRVLEGRDGRNGLSSAFFDSNGVEPGRETLRTHSRCTYGGESRRGGGRVGRLVDLQAGKGRFPGCVRGFGGDVCQVSWFSQNHRTTLGLRGMNPNCFVCG